MQARLVFTLALVPFVQASSQAVWTVDAKPMLDVPGASASGQVNFGNPAGVTRLKDGSLLVADRAGMSVRLIDARGVFVRAIGRTGDGPGEFESLLSATGCGQDSLLVWDLRKGQASIVGAGGVARQFRIPADSTVRVRRPLSMLACGSGGTIAYVSDPTGRRAPIPGGNPNVLSMLGSVVLTNRDGRVLSHVDSVPTGEMLHTVSPTGGNGGLPLPLGIASSVALVGDRAVLGMSDSARLIVVEPDGKRTTIPLGIVRRAPTQDEFDAAVASIADMAPASMRQTMMDQLSKAPMPAVAPAYTSVFSDPIGLLWLQVSPVGAKQMNLLAVQADGRSVARVTLPRSMTVYEIGRDYVLGTYADANDEVHVAVYHLTRR